MDFQVQAPSLGVFQELVRLTLAPACPRYLRLEEGALIAISSTPGTHSAGELERDFHCSAPTKALSEREPRK